MNLSKRRQIKLFLLTVLPLAIASLGMLWSTSGILDGISASVDRQEDMRTWQAVQSALKASLENLSNLAADNAIWDTAAAKTYGRLDRKWVRETWGEGSSEALYDTVFIVDAKGKRLTAFHGGAEINSQPADVYGPALARVLDALPKDKSTAATLSTLVDTPNGPAIMAASPLLPGSDGREIPADRPNVLIFSHQLDSAVLANISKQYIVDGLQLQRAGQPGHALLDHWGQPVAVAVWQARHPGNAARQSYRLSAMVTILALLGAIIPVSLLHGRAIAKMDRDERKAWHAARRDALCGLANRALMLERLNDALAAPKAANLALAFIDLDGFKAVNDTYDHQTGDKLICAVAAGLSKLVTARDLVARLGGDEFAILFSGPDAKLRASATADKILVFVKKPFDLDGRIANIGASIGIAGLDGQNLEAAELMRRADVAMYDAKENGRNRCRHFDAGLDAKRGADTAIAATLRSLIAEDRIEVAYQPVVDARTRSICGVEALARWPKLATGSLAPDRFIPLAEEHGLIDGLSRLILRTACRAIASWPDIRLSVNISALQFNNAALVPEIARIVTSNGLTLDRLQVKFTEAVLVKNPKRAKQVIKELRNMGIHVALDDFGTGYGAAGYLQDFAFDKIKLSRTLTQAMTRDIAAQQIVQGSILIARGLCAEVIAKGVETEEEAQLLHLAGCRELQGFLFHQPLSAEALHALFGSEPQASARASA